MVKERKLQSGVSNVPTPRDEAKGGPGSPGGVLFAGKSKFVRTWSHQLIAPEMYKKPDTGNKREVQIKTTATWRPNEVGTRDFTTTHKDTYLNPASIPVVDYGFKESSSEEIAAKNTELKMRQRAVDSMCKLVKSTHGTMAAMLRSYNKKRTDNLSVLEFSAYLRRDGLDTYVSESETQQVFDYVHPGACEVPVKDFLQKVEEVEFNRAEGNAEAQKIKDFLSLHLKAKRSNSQTSSQLDELKKGKAIENETEKMRKALGMKTYSLDVDHEEMNDIIETALDNKEADESQRKYARYLHHSNLKLSQIPFYDNRAIELDRLKHRAVDIHQTLHDAGSKDKFEKLSATYHRGSLTTSHSVDFLNTFQPRQMNLSQSMSELSLSARPSPLAPLTTAPLSDANTNTLNAVSTPSRRNLVTDSARGMPFPSSPRMKAPSQMEPLSRTKPSSQPQNYDIHPSDFLPTIYDEHQSMGRMKDAAKVIRVEKVDPHEDAKHGRRMVSDNVNWTNSFQPDPAQSQSQSLRYSGSMGSLDENPYVTTNSKFYSALTYKPSMPVTREGEVSEAEQAHLKKEYRRHQRYDRLKANMDVTANRLEYEAMHKELQSMHRTQSRIQNSIRYKSSIFLQDLRAFRTLPLQRMAKRQNIELSDRMWGGNAEKQVSEGRDFATTYGSSFDSSVLSQSMNINSLEGLRPQGTVH